ncbi:MAG: tyrosine-type recombinase/integrase [Desulforhopalus sp.]|nr:tyrosine-type recombinase/integrase [Desulforhopalus sp.]
MTREEVRQIVTVMEGTPLLIVKILYGSGLRVMEAVRLRIQDVDYAMKHICVRSGKGTKDRVTTFSGTTPRSDSRHYCRKSSIAR